jgi:hypothetical protein
VVGGGDAVLVDDVADLRSGEPLDPFRWSHPDGVEVLGDLRVGQVAAPAR